MIKLQYLWVHIVELARTQDAELLKYGYLDTVIGLPANLFFSTGISVCILVLKTCKKADDMLFINVAEPFENCKRQNQRLPEPIKKIIDTYNSRKEEAHYARRVSLAAVYLERLAA